MKRAIFAAWRVLAALTRPSARANLARLRARGESAATLRIREATAADVPAIARLHVVTWNATYAPLLMKGPGAALRERQWRDRFATPDGSWFCYVVERADGELVGFAQGGRTDHPEFAAELSKLYLRAHYQRVGLGRRLLGHAARWCLGRGLGSMWLFGDARNPSSRAWTALGARRTDRDPDTGNYAWDDLRALARTPE